jgi:hypothetical protein
MLQALLRTVTEILDSKKAAYSFIAAATAIVLHLQFGVSPENALLLVSPLGLATAAQAHVDAKRGVSTTASTSGATPSAGTTGGTPAAGSTSEAAPADPSATQG